MFASANEYTQLLWKIQKQIPSKSESLVPKGKEFINIDLLTRKINAPDWLSVMTDHRAEVVYFLMDRFHDNVDLSEMNCIVEYVNAAGKSGLYVVPHIFIGNESYYDENKIIIPWLIEGLATAKAGNITYSLKFFKTDEYDISKIYYILNTQPAHSRILQGNNFDSTAVQEEIEQQLGSTLAQIQQNGGNIQLDFPNSNIQGTYEYLVDQIHRVKDSGMLELYWEDV